MNTIREYFEFYFKTKQKNILPLKKFSFLDRKLTLVKYFKKEKNDIIKSINYAFFESAEDFLLSVFSKEDIYFIHINSRLTKKYPSNFSSACEYENYLAIYATFAILMDFSFQAQDLEDSRIFHKDFLEDLTFKIYYDDNFRLNLESFIDEENKILRYVYRYGYDFLLEFFRIYYKNSSKFIYLAFLNLLKIKESEFNELFALYRAKIILEEQNNE